MAVSSWDRHWQILIGAFLDRSACQSAYHCATVDDVLVLNRQNGHLLQYSFTFGNQYHVFDNRLQAFLRDGLVITARVQTVDTSSFTWQASLDASITSEELY